MAHSGVRIPNSGCPEPRFSRKPGPRPGENAKGAVQLTYSIDIYFLASEPVSSIAAALGEELRFRRRSIAIRQLDEAAPGCRSEGWAGYVSDERSGLPDNSLLLEVWQDSGVLRHRTNLLREEAEDQRFFQMNSLAVITLVGAGTDWPLVRTLWDVFSTLWPSIAYDEGSGFDVDMSELPES